MNLYLNDEHESLRRSVREFAEAEIAPVAAALDEKSRFPWENVKKMADLGYFGVNVPKQYGGLGLDYLSYGLIVGASAPIRVADVVRNP